MTAFWAALAAGGVAVVVGHEQRPERVRHVLADCAATVLLALEPMARSLTGLGLPASVRAVLPVGAEDTLFAGTPAPVDVISEDLAALVYTSGSPATPRA